MIETRRSTNLSSFLQVDSRNWKCLLQHLACAAAENPLRLGVDDAYFGAGLSDALGELTDSGRLGRSPKSPDGALHYIGVERSPSKGMSLRAIDPEKFVVVNTVSSRLGVWARLRMLMMLQCFAAAQRSPPKSTRLRNTTPQRPLVSCSGQHPTLLQVSF